MLSQKIFIFNPASIGSGKYTVELYFQNPSIGQFLNIGDYLEDTVNNKYSIVAPTVLPHSDGATVTVQFVDNDVLPIEDVDYNSVAYTPNQVDVRPRVRTSGSIANPSLFSGPNYEFSLTAGWDLPIEADEAQVGDSIVDLNGKEYTISFLDPVNRFNVPIRVIEVIKEAIAPTPGDASMFTRTTNYGLFQGTPISDPARTVVRNRDNVNLDEVLKDLQDQIDAAGGSGSGTAIEIQKLNDSGLTITQWQPVCISVTGGIKAIDISDEDDALAIVGIAKNQALDSEQCTVVSSGKLENISTSANFNDRLYLSKTGSITNVKPDIGVGGFVEGDFVVSLGVVCANSTTPTNKDLIVNIELIGQL